MNGFDFPKPRFVLSSDPAQTQHLNYPPGVNHPRALYLKNCTSSIPCSLLYCWPFSLSMHALGIEGKEGRHQLKKSPFWSPQQELAGSTFLSSPRKFRFCDYGRSSPRLWLSWVTGVVSRN